MTTIFCRKCRDKSGQEHQVTDVQGEDAEHSAGVSVPAHLNNSQQESGLDREGSRPNSGGCGNNTIPIILIQNRIKLIYNSKVLITKSGKLLKPL